MLLTELLHKTEYDLAKLSCWELTDWLAGWLAGWLTD